MNHSGPIIRGGRVAVLIVCGLAAVTRSGPAVDPAFPSSATPAHSDSAMAQDLPTLAVLDPVDLSDGRPDTRNGEFLRSGLSRSGRFNPLSRTEMERKLSDFAWNKGENCHEFQCGFEAGNVLLTDYVLFGTITPLKGLFAFTFNVLHIASGKVVHSEVGDVPRRAAGDGDEPLKSRLAGFVSGLDPAGFQKAELIGRGLMAVIDLSPVALESRVLSERITTHVNASRQYDLMSQSELRELLAAMEIRPGSIQTTDSGMLALGARLNAAYLVHSKLSREPGGTRLDLALFDVSAKRRVRDWPVAPTRDFRDILNMEHRFFTTLLDRGNETAWSREAAAEPAGPRAGWARGAMSLAGVSATAGLAWLALSMRKDADGDFNRAESAMSSDAGNKWKRRAEENDRRAVLYGSLAALTLGASIAVWTF